MNEQTDVRLARAARRAATRPFFLASTLAAFAAHEGMDDDVLAAFLGCAPSALPRLRLCRRPDPDAPDFRAAVAQIAAYTGAAIHPLARLLRDAAAIEALRGGAGRETTDGAGMLLAARDRPRIEDAGEPVMPETEGEP